MIGRHELTSRRSDISTVSRMNAVLESWIDPSQPPARATVEARLAAPALLIDIQVQAVV